MDSAPGFGMVSPQGVPPPVPMAQQAPLYNTPPPVPHPQNPMFNTPPPPMAPQPGYQVPIQNVYPTNVFPGYGMPMQSGYGPFGHAMTKKQRKAYAQAMHSP